MRARRLDRIFKPKRIALVGVTINPNSVGGKVLSNLVASGFQGVVYPVNPDYEAVLGIQCYPDMKSLPNTPDLAVICTGAEKVPDIVRECGETGVMGIIIMSAGFKEVGPEGQQLEDQIKAEIKKHDGMRVIGPNCLGIIVPELKMNVSFSNGSPKPGNVAFISQSGALCTSVLDWAIEEKIGFSKFISIGNTMDVDFGDLIDYLGEDDKTKSIILYVESITQARKFISAARPFARNKPIIVYKAGRFPESAEAAASHTGAMASEDAVYDAAFQRIGLSRVYDIGDIFNVAEIIGRNRIPKGSNLGIITNAGGPGVMATDALIAVDGNLAKLSDETMEKLNFSLPPMWSHGNPVDVLGDARAKRVSKAAKMVLDDPGVDAALVILTPQAMTNPTSTAKEIGKLAEKTNKPILTAWLGGHSMREGMQILNDAGIPSYQTPEQAVSAFMTLVKYSRNLKSLYETPKDVPVEFILDRQKVRSDFAENFAKNGKVLSEDISKQLVEAYGIASTRPVPALTEDEAVQIAEKMGYPVVLKIYSPDITHKTDVGGVALNLKNEKAVRQTFTSMLEKVQKIKPQARLDGVTVQPMVNLEDGVEMIIGIKKDPVFGTVIMCGMGGTGAELFGDKALGFPPLNERLARQMLESLKIWPLLNGYRGSEPVNVDKLIEVLIRMSYLAADYPEIQELDINPLLVTGEDVIALDARIVLDEELIGKEIKPYSHLALQPYPEKYVKQVELTDKTQVLLRPIKPEDEPLWLDLLASCSKESIYSRFRYAFHWDSHDVATRFCYIDYDREIAIVPEIVEDGKRKLLGVGRLIADPEHETVEYAILIADAWQERELGNILTDYCMEIAQKWNLKRIEAQTTTDNHRMLSVFRKRGFEMKEDGTEVFVHKDL